MRAALVLTLVASAAAPAHAYLDPGLAYSVLQPILVAIAGASAAIVSYRDRLRAWIGRRRRPREDAGESGVGENDVL